MSKILALLMVAMFTVGSLASCKSGKKPVRKRVSVDSTTVKNDSLTRIPELADTAVMDATIASLVNDLRPLWNKEIAYTTFSGKAKMHYEDGEQSHDFTANIRMKKDEAIWIFATAGFGVVNVARIYITPDSIKLINYLNKEVQLMPFSEVKKMFPLDADFASLQNFIIGNAFDKSGRIINATDFGGSWTLQIDNGQLQQQITYNKSDSTMRTLQMRPAMVTGPAGMIQFGNYGAIDNRMFANSRAVNILNEGTAYYIDMNYTQAEFDKPVEFPFSIPSSYTRK